MFFKFSRTGFKPILPFAWSFNPKINTSIQSTIHYKTVSIEQVWFRNINNDQYVRNVFFVQSYDAFHIIFTNKKLNKISSISSLIKSVNRERKRWRKANICKNWMH